MSSSTNNKKQKSRTARQATQRVLNSLKNIGGFIVVNVMISQVHYDEMDEVGLSRDARLTYQCLIEVIYRNEWDETTVVIDELITMTGFKNVSHINTLLTELETKQIIVRPGKDLFALVQPKETFLCVCENESLNNSV